MAEFNKETKAVQVEFTEVGSHEVSETVRRVEFGQIARQHCHQVTLGNVEDGLQVHECGVPDKTVGGDEIAAKVNGWRDECLGDDGDLFALEGPLGTFDTSLIDGGVVTTEECQAAQFPVLERADSNGKKAC